MVVGYQNTIATRDYSSFRAATRNRDKEREAEGRFTAVTQKARKTQAEGIKKRGGSSASVRQIEKEISRTAAQQEQSTSQRIAELNAQANLKAAQTEFARKGEVDASVRQKLVSAVEQQRTSERLQASRNAPAPSQNVILTTDKGSVEATPGFAAKAEEAFDVRNRAVQAFNAGIRSDSSAPLDPRVREQLKILESGVQPRVPSFSERQAGFFVENIETVRESETRLNEQKQAQKGLLFGGSGSSTSSPFAIQSGAIKPETNLLANSLLSPLQARKFVDIQDAIVVSPIRAVAKGTKESLDVFTGKQTPLEARKKSVEAIKSDVDTQNLLLEAFVGSTLNVVGEGVQATRRAIDPLLDRVLPGRKFYSEVLESGSEIHKGKGFDQYLLRFKGDVFEREGKKIGVTRVQKANLETLKKNPLLFGQAVIDIASGKKPGQIRTLDLLPGENIIVRDVPSEFASVVDELRIPTTNKLPVISATPDSSFLKEGRFSVTPNPSGEEVVLYGRSFTGGIEQGQFFAPPLSKTVAGVPSGTPQAYLFYTQLSRSASESGAATKVVPLGKKPALLLQQEQVSSFDPADLSKSYSELSQELASYTNPQGFSLSASTLKGKRTELEVIKVPSASTATRLLGSVGIPGRGRLELFSGSDVPITSKKEFVFRLESNIGFLEQRIASALGQAENNPSLLPKAQRLASIERKNIAAIQEQLALVKSLKAKDLFAKTDELAVTTKKLSSKELSDYDVLSKEFFPSSSPSKLVSFSDYLVSQSKKVRGSRVRPSKKSSSFSSSKASSTSISPSNGFSSSVKVSSKKSSPASVSISESLVSYKTNKASSPSVPLDISITGSPSRGRTSISTSISPGKSKKEFSGDYRYFSLRKGDSSDSSKDGVFVVTIGKPGNKNFNVKIASSLEDAARIAKRVVGGGAAASFSITRNGQRLSGEQESFVKSFLGDTFRKSKTSSDTFVEKNIARINTAGEKLDITFKGLQTLKKGRVSSSKKKTSKAVDFINQGFKLKDVKKWF